MFFLPKEKRKKQQSQTQPTLHRTTSRAESCGAGFLEQKLLEQNFVPAGRSKLQSPKCASFVQTGRGEGCRKVGKAA